MKGKWLKFILEDRRVTVENVAEHFGISYGTAQDIMSYKLGMRRVRQDASGTDGGKGQDVQ